MIAAFLLAVFLVTNSVDMTPDVRELVGQRIESAEEDARNTIRSISRLAQKKNWELAPIESISYFRAVEIRENDKTLVLAVIERTPVIVPSDWRVEVLLLSNDGTLLDKVFCVGSSRLSNVGKFVHRLAADDAMGIAIPYLLLFRRQGILDETLSFQVGRTTKDVVKVKREFQKEAREKIILGLSIKNGRLMTAID